MSEAVITETNQSPSERIAELENRIHELEHIVGHLRQDIVTITADHLQRLFNDEVMLDSLSQRILVSGANAIAYKAKASRARAPEMVVVEGYVPGAIRAVITEAGELILSEETQDGDWVSGDGVSEGLRQEETRKVFHDLLISYGVQADRTYYVIDDISLEEFRTQTAKRAMEITSAAEEEVAE